MILFSSSFAFNPRGIFLSSIVQMLMTVVIGYIVPLFSGRVSAASRIIADCQNATDFPTGLTVRFNFSGKLSTLRAFRDAMKGSGP